MAGKLYLMADLVRWFFFYFIYFAFFHRTRGKLWGKSSVGRTFGINFHRKNYTQIGIDKKSSDCGNCMYTRNRYLFYNREIRLSRFVNFCCDVILTDISTSIRLYSKRHNLVEGLGFGILRVVKYLPFFCGRMKHRSLLSFLLEYFISKELKIKTVLPHICLKCTINVYYSRGNIVTCSLFNVAACSIKVIIKLYHLFKFRAR